MIAQDQNAATAQAGKPAMTPPTQQSVTNFTSGTGGAIGAGTPAGAPTSTAGGVAGTVGASAPHPSTTMPTSQPGLAPAMPQAAPSAPTPTPQSAAPGLAPATGLPPTQSFGPGNDLRTTQINPSTDPRLAATQGQVSQQADKLANGPDRFQLAQDRFKTFADQTDPAYQASIRAATQKAAANGAIGSGMLGTDYGNLALQHTRDLTNERDSLFNNALEGTIGDTRANVGLLSGLEGQQFGEGVSNQNALRGERDYQNGMENQAYQRGVQGLGLEDQLTNSAFGRGLATSQFGAQGNPAATELGLAGMYGQQASDAGNSLGQMVQSNATNGILQSIYGGAKPPQAGGSPAGTPSPDNNLWSMITGGN